MRYVESVSKVLKNFSAFCDQNWPKKDLAKNITARRSTEWSIDSFNKIGILKLNVQTGLKVIALAFWKFQKIIFFFPNNSAKKNSAAENVEYNRLWTRRNVYKKSNKSDQ